MTSEAVTIERLANSLFVNINQQKTQERVLLVCPVCRAGMEALELSKDALGYQTIWWVCKNTIEQKCTFPGDMPPDVFWVQRSPEQCAAGIIPPPNREALPRDLWHLYPSIFGPQRGQTLEEVAELPPHPIPRSVEEASFRTFNASLASDLNSLDEFGQPYEPSVIVIEHPSDAKVGVANSFTTNETNSSSEASSAAGLVPTTDKMVVLTTTTRSKKRRATSMPRPGPRSKFLYQLDNHLKKLKDGGIKDEELARIAEKYLEVEQKHLDETYESDFKKQFMRQDDYCDSIQQRIPEVSKEQVQQVIKEKHFTHKFQVWNAVRSQKSGSELLKTLGLAGAPVNVGNKWRTDTRQEVDSLLSLRKAARETQKALNKEKTPTKSPGTRVSLSPSTSKGGPLEEARQRQLEQEAETKTRALVQSKLRERIEASKQLLQEKQRQLNDRLRQQPPEAAAALSAQQLQDLDVLFAAPEPQYPCPLAPGPSRQRIDSLGSFDGFGETLAPTDGYSDLFDSLDTDDLGLL